MDKTGVAGFLCLYFLVLSVTMGVEYSHAQERSDELATRTWTQALNGLRLSIDTPTQNYKDSNAFQLSVLFENVGKEKIILLPQSIRRNYQAKGQGAAKYVPFPGPRISLWKDAFTLLPGQKNKINLVGMRNGDGIWTLELGAYDLSIRYIVPLDWTNAYARDFPDSKAQLWTGSIESEKLTIKCQP